MLRGYFKLARGELVIKILHTLPALDGGGAEKIIYDYCIRMPEKFHFDFITHTDYIGILEEKLKKRGCEIFHVPTRRENRKKNQHKIEEIIKNGKYDIIHVSQGYRGVYLLWASKKYGIPIRIAHSHMSCIPESLKDRITRKVATIIVKALSTDLFACGKDAAKWMWGSIDNVFIMTNAIESDKYSFDNNVRISLRKELGIENKLVIGNVARFSYQKNHDFIIDLAKEITKLNKNVAFLLVGRGELLDDIKARVSNSGMDDYILFLGVRSDVQDLLNAMDIFILPSRYEGLPVTLVETQANGLTSIVSNKITREIKFADNMVYLPIDSGTEKWVKSILNMKYEHSSNAIKNTSYDINNSVCALVDKYKELLKGKEVDGKRM